MSQGCSLNLSHECKPECACTSSYILDNIEHERGLIACLTSYIHAEASQESYQIIIVVSSPFNQGQSYPRQIKHCIITNIHRRTVSSIVPAWPRISPGVLTEFKNWAVLALVLDRDKPFVGGGISRPVAAEYWLVRFLGSSLGWSWVSDRPAALASSCSSCLQGSDSAVLTRNQNNKTRIMSSSQ